MRYSYVHGKVWRDEKIRGLSMEQKLLFLYLMTCPHGNSIGIFVLPLGYIIEDLNPSEMVSKRLSNHIATLSELSIIEYDEETCICWIKNYLKYNRVQNPNQRIAAKILFDDLPKSMILRRFLDYINTFDETLCLTLSKGFTEPLPKPFANGIVHNPNPNPNHNQKISCSKSKPDPDFDTFWKAYPRKIAKAKALQAWKKWNGNRPDIQIVVSKIDQFKKTDQWTEENGKYIPYPASWINAGGWDDEPKIETSRSKPPTFFDTVTQ